MILLDGHSLTAAMVVPAEKMSLQLKERESTATMTPAGLDGVGVNSWLLDDKGPGAGIVWRVRTIQNAFDTKTPTVQLEHVISTLKDRILFGEITPKTITGDTSATTCTAKQAVQYILGQQSDWTLGDFDYDEVSNPYKFDGDTLFDALETVTNSLENAWWSYDMSSYPFTISITERSEDVESELRAGRNLRTISRTIDRNGMFTRFYPIGKDDLHVSSSYIEKNTATYGVISKVETDTTLDTEAELTAWANEQLDKHAEPLVTITAEGYALAEATGESLDALTIGRVCRVPLPEYDTTITERIAELTWTDKISQPEVVKVTLANSRTDVTRIIANAIKKSGKSRRTSTKKDKTDKAWFEDTNDHVAMVATGIIGVDAQGNPNWTRLSEYIADGQGMRAKVETQMNGISDRMSIIIQNESEIRAEVAAESSQFFTAITQTASGIHTEILNTKSNLYAYIDQTASYFRQVYLSETNHVWIQDTNPTIGGATPKEGDVWIESTSHGTWDGASGFDWEHDEDYDWLQVQGAKIWGWKNNQWELVSDQQQVVTMTDVEQTSEHIVQQAIRVLVNDDGNLSVYRAELLVEGDRIRSEVYEAISGMGSSIEQTASAIRSEVHAAQSALYSFILQTASQITIRVGESNMVFKGMTKPEGTEDHPLVDGDLWLKSTFQRTWADMEELDAWIDDEDFDWSDLRGSKIYVYDAELGDFREVMDEQVLAQDTDIEETSEKISLVARSIKQVDGKVDVFRAELSVKADKIESRVNQRIDGLGSTITQTASQIRAEVHAAQSTIYSSITQTASQIRAEVVDTANGLSSAITQTASQIRTEVNASNSQIYSSITQTASQIRSEVASSVSGLQSSITQNANRIALVVDGNGIKPAAIVASINDAGSSVKISAGKISLDGSTTINDVMSIGTNHVSLSRDTRIQGDIMAETLTLRYGSSSVGISEPDLAGMIKNASVSGNTLTLTKVDGSTVTFSKATTLSGAWSSGKFTVSASPQGNSNYTELKSVANADITWNGNTASIEVKAYNNGSETPISTGKTLTVDASSRYTAGWEDYYDSSYWSSPSINSSGVVTENGEVKIPKKDGSGSVVWFTINDIHRTRYTLNCTSVEPTYPGSTTKFYYFRLEGSYSFSANNNYYFYR